MNPSWEIYTLPVPRQELRLGGPFAISTAVHAALIFLLVTLARQLALQPMEPVKVLEINVMGKEDLALKGAGGDFSAGPMPDKTLLAQPAREAGKVVPGNTHKISRALARSAPPAPPRLPTLTAKGPLFSSGKSSVAGGAGREKIYVSAAIKSRPDNVRNERGGEGEGLVGVTGAQIDLNAKRETGGDESGASDYLSGAEGSVGGGSVLSRRGEAVIADSSGVSDDRIIRKQTVKLEAPSDDFFSISGPLRGRKILKISLPKYPRWAEEQGLEARIALRITVTARGKVKPDIIVEQTSGFPEFDKVVLESVRSMVYAPLPFESGNSEQWGIATFNFNLKKARGD